MPMVGIVVGRISYMSREVSRMVSGVSPGLPTMRKQHASIPASLDQQRDRLIEEIFHAMRFLFFSTLSF